MDQTAMVAEDIEVGRQALEAFDELGPTTRCAFWIYRPDTGDWRLMVATPLVDSDGPLAAYDQIATTLQKKHLLEKLPLARISAIGTRDELLQLLRKVARTALGSTSGIRVRESVIKGVHVEDAYIYRMT